MKTNMYKDEDSLVKDRKHCLVLQCSVTKTMSFYLADLYEPLENIINSIVDSLSGPAKKFYENEFNFFGKVTAISGEIRPYPKGPERKKALLVALGKIRIQDGCYLPPQPESLVIDIDRNNGVPLQSAAKAPFLARFQVIHCGQEQLETFAMTENNQDKNYIKTLGPCKWQAAIFKVGDDVRQDMLALQIIDLFKQVFKKVGLDLFLFPYKVVATSPGVSWLVAVFVIVEFNVCVVHSVVSSNVCPMPSRVISWDARPTYR